MVLVAKWPFFQLFFLGNIGQENVFYDIPERKNAFLGYKNKKFKQSKINIFPKGLTHGVGPKMAIFPSLFFYAIQAMIMSFTIFRNEKTPFQAIKTRSSNSRKIAIFPKGLTHGFSPKNGHFSNFFFQAIQARKMSFMLSQNEKTPLQAIKTKTSKSRKMAIFPSFFFWQYRPGKCLL